MVTVTNDKFNLKIILTFFLSSEVRTGFILNPIHGSLMCHLWDRRLTDVSLLSHRPSVGRVLVSPGMVHSSPMPSYPVPYYYTHTIHYSIHIQFISWNKNSQVILKKKNLSLVTVTNDKFNLKKILTIFFDLEVRIVFISLMHGLTGSQSFEHDMFIIQ